MRSRTSRPAPYPHPPVPALHQSPRRSPPARHPARTRRCGATWPGSRETGVGAQDPARTTSPAPTRRPPRSPPPRPDPTCPAHSNPEPWPSCPATHQPVPVHGGAPRPRARPCRRRGAAPHTRRCRSLLGGGAAPRVRSAQAPGPVPNGAVVPPGPRAMQSPRAKPKTRQPGARLRAQPSAPTPAGAGAGLSLDAHPLQAPPCPQGCLLPVWAQCPLAGTLSVPCCAHPCPRGA